MALRSARWSWGALVVFGSIAAGCGDDASAPTGVTLQPVPGCEAIDPSPCDVFVTGCQTRLMALAACMRGSSPQPLPPVSRMTEGEYAQLLTAEILAEEPPPNLNHYEAALVMLGLAVPGAFAPSSMAAARAAWVWGFYRSDLDDIVLIDRGLPADDIDVVGVFLHELVHALQDRDQDLPTWYDLHVDTYDTALAAMSVVEGEARLHQQRFGVSLLGLDPKAVDLARHFDNTVRRAEQWVRSQPSPYLASYSAFPYEFGARLLWPRYVQRGPQAIAELFSAPPADTRALLDPGNDAAVPAWPAPVAPAPPPEWALTQETTLGAWATYLFLARDGLTADAQLQALGWRGDRLWVYGGGDSAAPATALVWRLAFADEASAMLVSQRLSPPFASQRFGAELVIAATNAAAPIDWAFAVPAPNAPAPGDDGSQLATDSSASDWLNRVLIRRQKSIPCAGPRLR
jgi:hypothetical protein